MVSKSKYVPLLALALCGCAAGAAHETPVVTAVPVPVECPAPPRLSLPQLPIASLTAAAPPAEVAKSYAVSVQMLKDAVKERDLLLDAYRSSTDENAANHSAPDPATIRAPR